MKELNEEVIEKIIRRFGFDGKIKINKVVKYEPDCYIYLFSDIKEGKYALICRDLIQDDLEAEKRILKNELNMEVIDRFGVKTGDYWVTMPGLDEFDYVFSLIGYR